MLTIYGTKSRFLRWCFAQKLSEDRRARPWGADPSATAAGEAQSGVRRSHKAVIMIFLPGGPSHQDMFDLKMDAPSEIRGEFKPIKTNVPGIQICEHLPRIGRHHGQMRHHPVDGRRDRMITTLFNA